MAGYNGSLRSQFRAWRSATRFTISLLAIAFMLVRAEAGDNWQPAASNRPEMSRRDGNSKDDTIGKEFKWTDIEPSRTLTWESCYEDAYECARLDVPMDWINPTDDERVVLGVIKLKASTTNTTNYKGAVFFNPGGPGGSGIFALRDRGAKLQGIIGNNHDLITWDPRGVGVTTPRADCWGGSAENRRVWALGDVGVINSHPGISSDAYARSTAFSQMCERNMNDTGLLPHISTAAHARDLLELMEQAGEEKLKFWGFSYGTVLGGVFASMYPDKVGRFVSDGRSEDIPPYRLGKPRPNRVPR